MTTGSLNQSQATRPRKLDNQILGSPYPSGMSWGTTTLSPQSDVPLSYIASQGLSGLTCFHN